MTLVLASGAHGRKGKRREIIELQHQRELKEKRYKIEMWAGHCVLGYMHYLSEFQIVAVLQCGSSQCDNGCGIMG